MLINNTYNGYSEVIHKTIKFHVFIFEVGMTDVPSQSYNKRASRMILPFIKSKHLSTTSICALTLKL